MKKFKFLKTIFMIVGMIAGLYFLYLLFMVGGSIEEILISLCICAGSFIFYVYTDVAQLRWYKNLPEKEQSKKIAEEILEGQKCWYLSKDKASDKYYIYALSTRTKIEGYEKIPTDVLRKHLEAGYVINQNQVERIIKFVP